MRLRSERLVLVGTVVVVAAVSAMVAFTMIADRRLTSAKAKLAKSSPLRSTAAATGQPGQPDRPNDVRKAAALDPAERLARFTDLTARTKDVRDSGTWEEILGRPMKDWTDADWERVKADVAGMRDLIRQIRELAEAGGFSKEIDLSEGFDIDLSHLAPLRQLARILSLDALIQARTGNNSEAVQDIAAIMQLANGIAGEPTLISQLVRIAIDGMACATARDILVAGGLSPGLTRELLESASLSGRRDYFTDALYGESASATDAFERVGQGAPVEHVLQEDWLSASDPSYDTGTSDDLLVGLRHACTYVGLRAYGSALGTPWRALDEASYAELFQSVADAAQLPYYQAKPILDEIGERVHTLPATRILSRQLLEPLAYSVLAQAREETNLDLMRIGLSVDQYHTRTGSYPESLGAIAPDLGGAVPVDPHTGQPYVYRVSDGGYLLYSVSMNLVDDGGVDDPRNGDIVWHGTTQRKEANRPLVAASGAPAVTGPKAAT